MVRYLCFAGLLFAVLILSGGCFSANVDTGGSDRGGRYAAPPDPASDPRSTADLQRENAQLRTRLAGLEKDYAGWQTALDRQKSDKRELERQRDELKKDRDRYKKLLKD